MPPYEIGLKEIHSFVADESFCIYLILLVPFAKCDVLKVFKLLHQNISFAWEIIKFGETNPLKMI